MTSIRHSRLLRFSGLILCALVWLANNSNPPTGRTGAPFDGNCNNCHGGSNPGNFDGDLVVDGLPGTIQPGVTYPLTITMTPTAGNPIKGGFQLVVVDGSNANAGNLTNSNSQSGTEMFGGREYLEHRSGKTFGGNPISWSFTWASPASGVSGNTIKIYAIANFANGNGGDSGDFIKSDLFTYPFEAPPALSATIVSSTNVLCNGGNTGSATVEGSGGNTPYTYHWSNNQSTATAVNLVAGTYTVTVTGAGGSGTATASIQITQPTTINLTASVTGSLNCNQTSVNATASATGGTPGYSFSWSNGETGNTASFDAPGSYTVTVTDDNGCTKVAPVTVTQNIVEPTVNVAPAGAITCTVSQLTLSGAGSSQGGSFSYLWTATNGGNIVSGATTLTPLVNSCGTYTLRVMNNTNGCTATASTDVNCEIDPPGASIASPATITCAVTSVVLDGSSGTSGVNYSWTGPNGFSSNVPDPSVTAPGNYTLTVVNPANNCSSVATVQVLQNIAVPTDTTHVTGMLTCTVNEVSIFMTTNIQNATYSWTGPNNFTSTQKRDTIAVPGNYIGIVTNPINGCKSRDTVTVIQNTTVPGAAATVSGPINCANASVQLTGGPSGANNFAWTGPNNFSSTQQNPTVNTAGTYTLLVTGQVNNCTSSATITVLENISAPTASVATPGSLNCNNSTIQLNASASSQGANFSYLWSTQNGVIQSGATTLTPVVSAAGVYTLVVSDSDNSCSSSVSVTVNQSTAVLASIASSQNVSCQGNSNGSANAAATGGSGTYTYLWSNGATTASASGLAAGTYVVTITDTENCVSTASVTISQPDALSANATVTGETAVGANNGTATAVPTGGTPAYTYAWSNSENTPTITGLAPGSYTVTISDSNGCSAVQTVTVNAFGCSLAASIASTNITCHGAANGTASLTLTGAANPVTFAWSTGATTQDVSGLAAGSYTVSILDANNCPAVLNTTISEPTAVSANASSTNETSSGANNGTATATPTGGSGTYTYLWSNSATTASISGLAPGSYTVTVSDANNCTATQTVNVSSFNCALEANITGANVSCFGGNDGLATAVLNGGQLPYTYAWSNASTTATINNLSAGVYTVTATDAAGCVTTSSITLTQPATALTALADNIQNVICPSDLTGSANIVANGGTAPYNITGPLGNLGAGTHTVTVTDSKGCTTTVTFEVISLDSEAPVITCPSNIIFCGASQVNYPSPTATDNCSPVGVVLISGQPSGTPFNDGTTIQTYRATDLSGNSSTCSFAVIVHPLPDILFDGSTDDHNGEGVGTISITAIGGSGSGYLYAWNKNGQFFSTSEDLTGLNAGSYTLTITDANGCETALSPIVIGNTVGTSDLANGGSIRLFPNPATSSFKLEIIEVDVIGVTIMDTKGRLVYKLQPAEWQSEVAIDKLASGIYFVRLATESGQVVTLKFVKSE